ncbi:MAG TPA: DNA methyltransferase [Candidatus Dojkabacteria bacterium]|nr:DNA methyltransferase [Candidatus Dojkabacteria bacterium]
MSKQYFFQAGSFPNLSYVELVSVFQLYGLSKDNIHLFTEDIFIIKSDDVTEEILSKIFNRLGGFVRYGEIIENTETFLKEFRKSEDRVVFGISLLGELDRLDARKDNTFIKKLANQIKKGLRESGLSVRFLIPRGSSFELNAAQVLNNDILEKGFELSIIRNQERREEIYGNTIAIQDLEGYIERDMNRPYSDIKMGVLPPKLARMMINFAGLKDGTIWDPFCGSGTILMEAAVLGYNFLGSDIDENALYYSEENIKWLNKKGYIGDVVYELFKLDVTDPDKEIIKELKNTKIDAIICEPFMGPPQKDIVSEDRADNLLNSVKELYMSLFKMLDEEVGVRGSKMVLIIPSYKTNGGWKTFSIYDVISNRWELLNSELLPNKDLKWGRKNSIITRNIYILRRT